MGRHFLLSAAIACAATATAATGKYYLVKTTGSGFSLTLSWSDRQNFGQGFGKGVTILCTNHELSQLPNGVNNVQIGGTVWSCQILKTFNSDKELAKW